MYHNVFVTQNMERKRCTNKTTKINNYSVLNVAKSLNSQQKTKNSMQEKDTQHQKDALSAVKTEKHLETTVDLEAVLAEKEESTQ